MQKFEPFRFCTRQNLIYLTGLKAKNLNELLEELKIVSEKSIYHHTHHFLQQHIFHSPEPTNDFAYWLSNVYQDEVLGEKIASVDLREYIRLSDIRDEFIRLIEEHMKGENFVDHNVPNGEEFYFMEAQMYVFPTNIFSRDLTEFKECLKKVSVYSIYYHMIESQLWTGSKLCDYSNWLITSLNEIELAENFMKIDPYTQTLENLRSNLINLIEKRLKEKINDQNK